MKLVKLKKESRSSHKSSHAVDSWYVSKWQDGLVSFNDTSVVLYMIVVNKIPLTLTLNEKK